MDGIVIAIIAVGILVGIFIFFYFIPLGLWFFRITLRGSDQFSTVDLYANKKSASLSNCTGFDYRHEGRVKFNTKCIGGALSSWRKC